MKEKFIFTGKHGRPSTKLVYGKMTLGTLIQRRQVFKKVSRELVKTYYRVFKSNNPDLMYKEPTVDATNSVVVRWGTREPITTDNHSIVYNKSEAIAKITDKVESRRLFARHNVSAPKLVTLENVEPQDFPIIRRPFIHSKGRNFVVLNNMDELRRGYAPNSFYYSAFVDKDREFRIHVAHSKVLAVMEKVPNKHSIAWNRAVTDSDPFTYVPWSEVDKQNLTPVLVEAIKAVLATGADMGGVDVMLKGTQPYVLEVNSAPTLNSSDYVAGRWAQYFNWLFRSETRRPHWDYTQYKKGSSLIWKNYQLDETKEYEFKHVQQ